MAEPSYRYREQTLLDRFDAPSADGCWPWRGDRNGKGYGRMFVRRADGRPARIAAHRVMYERIVGPISAGLTIDHLCRNKVCVNPAHLEPVTIRENIRRGTSDHCRRGHAFDEANTRLERSKSGTRRRCRACATERLAA